MLRRPDVVNLETHYSSSPSSGFWVLEFNGNIIGTIAVDAIPDSQPEKPPGKKGKAKEKKGATETSVALIRHFYVDEQYRRSGIQDDLLSHAVKHAFESNAALRQVKAADSPLTRYIRKSLQTGGFRLDQHTETIGVFRWKLGMRVLEREEWEKQVSAKN